jgi:hypothetical protein
MRFMRCSAKNASFSFFAASASFKILAASAAAFFFRSFLDVGFSLSSINEPNPNASGAPCEGNAYAPDSPNKPKSKSPSSMSTCTLVLGGGFVPLYFLLIIISVFMLYVIYI